MSLDSLLLNHRQFIGHTEYAGIDKIRISFPLYTAYSDGSAGLFSKSGVRKTLKSGSELEYAKGSFTGPGGDTIYFEIKNNASIGVLEFNPSRSLDLNGSTLCHPNRLVELVIDLIIYLANHTVVALWLVDTATGEVLINEPNRWPINWKRMVRVSRLDGARDIYSPYRGFDIGCLTSINKPRYSKHTLVENTRSSEIETMIWGKKSNVRHSLYNKSLKHDGNSKGGWFRFEVQASYSYLKSLGMETLEGITEESVFNLLWHRWEVSNLDSAVSIGQGQSNLVEEFSKHLSGVKVQTFIGLSVSLANGYKVDMNPRVINQYREIGERCGFSLGQSLESFGGLKVKLDFSQGEVVPVEQVRILEYSQTPSDISEILVSTIGETT